MEFYVNDIRICLDFKTADMAQHLCGSEFQNIKINIGKHVRKMEF